MVMWGLRAVHNLTRPGQEPQAGDRVEIECVGGFVMRVDPKTWQNTSERQVFTYMADGALVPRKPSTALHLARFALPPRRYGSKSSDCL